MNSLQSTNSRGFWIALLLLVAMPLLLVVRPGASSSALVTSSKALVTSSDALAMLQPDIDVWRYKISSENTALAKIPPSTWMSWKVPP